MTAHANDADFLDDRRRCQDCADYSREGQCIEAARRKLAGIRAVEMNGDHPARKYRPHPTVLRRCAHFKPMHETEPEQ